MRLALIVALSLAFRAAAADDPTRRQFDPDPARLAFSLDGGFTTETAGAARRGMFRFVSVLDVANGLLVLQQGTARNDLLVSRGQLDLLAGYSLGFVELAAELPIALWQDSDFSFLTAQGVTGPLVDSIASTTIGDLRLGAKVPILDPARWPIGLAAVVDFRLPTGNGTAFMSDGWALAPSVVVTRSFGRVRLDAQLGYIARNQGQYAQLIVHDGYVYALGGSFDLPKAGLIDRWKAIAELDGGWPRGDSFSSTDRYRAPLEVRGGVRAFLTPRVSVEAGLGTGLGPVGYGHERWRAFVGISWGSPNTPAERAFVGPQAPDRDGDGVPDDVDRCPDQPGPADLDGCPDDDDDGIPNWQDKCPKQPGPAEHDGCPLAEGEPLVEITSKRIMLNDSINFDTGKDTIKSSSYPVLDQVAKLLNDHPEMKKVRVEGHTDNVGNAGYNKELSHRRASSVVRYLVAKGVAESRLVPMGYGFEQPIASNATALGRAKNRRVAFTVLEEGR
ncbi:MAG: OmpA family protein [Myxococcales bacterium]|nr:OmpA family protein [Myxococcales bacterium]